MGKYEHICDNNIVRGIEEDDAFEMQQLFRLWKHDKGNFTRWHYDGNGADLLNVCIQGAKDFYLRPPRTLPVWPLASICAPFHFEETYRVRLGPGEMLYLPAYWFHKVITLEDKSINMNYIFFNRSKELSSTRDIDIYTLHSMMNTHMCEDPICKIMNDPDKRARAIVTGLMETFPLFVLFLLVLWLFKENKTMKVVWPVATVIGLSICYIYPYFDVFSFGLTKLVSFFVLVWIILFYALTTCILLVKR
jgi:hypothetical protein